MNRHTPGPWLMDEAGIYTEAGTTVANVQKCDEADAKLIAAAPDLLAACQALAAGFDNDELCDCTALLDMLAPGSAMRTAIDKATQP